jgi:hypothetical protein
MCHKLRRVRFMVMVFNTTINNISAISWRSVLLVEETAVHGETHRPAQVTNKLYMKLHQVHFAMSGIPTNNNSGHMDLLYRQL